MLEGRKLRLEPLPAIQKNALDSTGLFHHPGQIWLEQPGRENRFTIFGSSEMYNFGGYQQSIGLPHQFCEDLLAGETRRLDTPKTPGELP